MCQGLHGLQLLGMHHLVRSLGKMKGRGLVKKKGVLLLCRGAWVHPVDDIFKGQATLCAVYPAGDSNGPVPGGKFYLVQQHLLGMQAVRTMPLVFNQSASGVLLGKA